MAWANIPGTSTNISACPYNSTSDDVCINKKGCIECIFSSFWGTVCGWSLSENRCAQLNDPKATGWVNAIAQCPWSAAEDQCGSNTDTNSSCVTCTSPSIIPHCGWYAGNNTCWGISAPLPLINESSYCSYTPSDDKCRNEYRSQCFLALTKGKGDCGFLVKNNTAVELKRLVGISKDGIITNSSLCPIAGTDPCNTPSYQGEPTCDRCVAIEDCGWYTQNNSCEGLHKRHLPLVKKCPLGLCGEIKDCVGCSQHNPSE